MMARFWKWLVGHFVQDCPTDLTECEWCRETVCTEEKRENCKRRIK